MASICRLCATLKNLNTFVCIHESNLDLLEKLEKCFQLIIPRTNDILPQNVCNECVIKLNNSWRFYQKVHESQDSLSKIFYLSDNEDEINDGKFYEKLTCPVITTSQTISNRIDNIAITNSNDEYENDNNIPANNEEYENENCSNEYDNENCSNTLIKNNLINKINEHHESNDNNNIMKIEIEEQLQNFNNHHITVEEDDNDEMIDNNNELMDNNNNNDDETTTIQFHLEDNCYNDNLNINSNNDNIMNYQLEVHNENSIINDNENNIILLNESSKGFNELLQNNDNSLNNYDEQSSNLDEILETWQDYPWKCIDCNDYIGKNAIELREHVVTLHGSEWSVKYICNDCLKTFDKYYSFINHIKQRHRKHLNLCCDLCSDIFDNIQLLIDHRQLVHYNLIGGNNSLVNNNNGNKSKSKKFNEFNLYFCTICIKAFNSNNALMVHKKGHEPDKYRYQCDICTKKFATKPNLKAHLKIHTGLKEYVCDHCAKGFVQKANLEEHMLIHIKDEPFKCEECNKKFKTPDRLAKHKAIHTDIRPHKCNECGNTFREKDTLRVHMRIHTGVMPYECEHCGKRFRFRSVLTTHRHQHTGERPYSCTDCNHHFTNWPNFNKHMKRRHGINTASQSHRNGQTNIE